MGDTVRDPPLRSCNKHESNDDSILNAHFLLTLFCFDTQFLSTDFACQSPFYSIFNSPPKARATNHLNHTATEFH